MVTKRKAVPLLTTHHVWCVCVCVCVCVCMVYVCVCVSWGREKSHINQFSNSADIDWMSHNLILMLTARVSADLTG